MPPKAKFTKDKIISAALEIVRRDGAGALTARALGAELNSSARPLFTVFDSMEQIRAGVLKFAESVYARYVDEGLKEQLAFKGVGKAYIRFAAAEPRLFQLLFMSGREQVPEPATVLPLIEENYQRILQSVQTAYGLNEQLAARVYRHMWIYSHGIAVLIATRMCAFTADGISEMLTEAFKGIIANIKESKND